MTDFLKKSREQCDAKFRHNLMFPCYGNHVNYHWGICRPRVHGGFALLLATRSQKYRGITGYKANYVGVRPLWRARCVYTCD